MKWKNKDLTTLGDVMRHGIDACDTQEEAREFMRLYREETASAAQNVGYLAGYYDRETKHRIFSWFQCAHPIFGTYDPTPEEAIRAGMQMANRRKRELLTEAEADGPKEADNERHQGRTQRH